MQQSCSVWTLPKPWLGMSLPGKFAFALKTQSAVLVAVDVNGAVVVNVVVVVVWVTVVVVVVAVVVVIDFWPLDPLLCL